MNNKPIYKKLDNNLLHLMYTDAPGYDAPWTMWGASHHWTKTHIGNIKIGPRGLPCPTDGKQVST